LEGSRELREHKLVHERKEDELVSALIFEQPFCRLDISHWARCVVYFAQNVYERLFSRLKSKEVDERENNDSPSTLLDFVYRRDGEVCICFDKSMANVSRSVRCSQLPRFREFAHRSFRDLAQERRY